MLSKPAQICLLAVFTVVALLMASCGATPIAQVEAPLLGTWHGESMVRPPISFVPPPTETPRPPEVTVDIDITIHEDASVTGTVGGAELKDCVLKRNRGDLGRSLNVASDYIIMDGYLDGPVIPGDEELRKDFTIPFNLVDDHMQGSVMWLKDRKYPFPLLRVDLEQEP